jgi:hypothetical protein
VPNEVDIGREFRSRGFVGSSGKVRNDSNVRFVPNLSGRNETQCDFTFCKPFTRQRCESILTAGEFGCGESLMVSGASPNVNPGLSEAGSDNQK